jgi:hypothetical protein
MRIYKNINNFLKNKNIKITKANLLINPYFYKGLNHFLENKKGGGRIEHKISIDKNQVIIEEDINDENEIVYSLMTNSRDKECLLMYKKNDSIHIESINAWDNCLMKDKKNINGTLLVKIALKFIDSIKEEKKIKKIFLIDKAEKGCNGYSFNLSNFKILLSGDTWYGAYDFLPAMRKTGSEEIIYDKNAYVNYLNNKKIISKLLVKDSSIEKIIIKKIKNIIDNKIKNLLEELLLIIKKQGNKLLSDVLKNYLTYEKINERCIVLKYIMDKLFKNNKLTQFNDKLFIKYL